MHHLGWPRARECHPDCDTDFRVTTGSAKGVSGVTFEYSPDSFLSLLQKMA